MSRLWKATRNDAQPRYPLRRPSILGRISGFSARLRRLRRRSDDLEANIPPFSQQQGGAPVNQQGDGASTLTTYTHSSTPLSLAHPQPTVVSGPGIPTSVNPSSQRPSLTLTTPRPQDTQSQILSPINTTSTVQSTPSHDPIFTSTQSSPPTQTSQPSQSHDIFYPRTKHEIYIKEIGKYARLCNIKDRILQDEYFDIHSDLSFDLKKEPRRSGHPFDFEINLCLARDKESSSTTTKLHLLVTCGTEEEKSIIEPRCKRHKQMQDFLIKHSGTLEVFVTDAASKAEPASSSDLSISMAKTGRTYPRKCKLLLAKGQKCLYGGMIEIRSESGSFICYCTLGGFVLVGSRVYGWTAKHCLSSDKCLSQVSNSTLTDKATETSYQHVDDGRDIFDVELVYPAIIHNPGRRPSEFDYDWLLLDFSKLLPSLSLSSIYSSDTQLVRSTLPERTEPEEPVEVFLQGPNKFSGVLNPYPATITLGGRMHRVKIIELEQPLPKGSSGAWVLFNQQLCGFVIAVRKERAWAYMIPIQEAFRDVNALMGEEIRVATTEDLDEVVATTSRSALKIRNNQAELPPSGMDFDRVTCGPHQSRLLSNEAPCLLETMANSPPQSPAARLKAATAPFCSSEVVGIPKNRNRVRLMQEKLGHLVSRISLPTLDPNSPHARVGLCRPMQRSLKPGKRLLLLDGADLHKCATRYEGGDHAAAQTSALISGLSAQHNPTEVNTYSSRSNASIARNHYSQGGFKSPRKVVCRLLIGFNGSQIEEVGEYMFSWLADRATFQELMGMVEVLLKEKGYTARAKGYLRSGTCSLFYNTTEDLRNPDQIHLLAAAEARVPAPYQLFDSVAVENEIQWRKNVPSLILRFCGVAQDTPFYLEIFWDIIQLSPGLDPVMDRSELMNSLLHNNRRWNWENRSYVPQKALRNIMSPPLISYLVQSSKGLHTITGRGKELADFDHYLTHSAWRLMAAAISARLPLQILFLLKERNIDDTKMPLNSKMRPPQFPVDQFEKIVSEQYAFLALSFGSSSRTTPYRIVPKEMIVPLNFDGEKDRIGKRYSAEVFKADLDPEHHDFSRSSSQFAIKRFNRRSSASEEENRREQRILTNLSMIRHDHLLAPVTSWQQSNFLFMLFPRANSNLQSFLHSAPVPNLSREVILGFLNQLRSIADAVRIIHNTGPAGLAPIEAPGPANVVPAHIRSGFHHDIKPSNILVFSHSGQSVPTWVLSDFGVARIWQTFLGVDAVDGKEPLQYHDDAYGAPDLQSGYKPSCPYDIWSLGCIYLEFLLWMCGVEPDLDAFAQGRRKTDGSESFWYCTQGKVSLKPIVIKALKDLRTYAESRGVFEPLVQVVQNMLVIEPYQRHTAPTVVNDLDAILLQVSVDLREDDFYLVDRTTSHKLAAPPSNAASSSAWGTVGTAVRPGFEVENVGNLDLDANAHNVGASLTGTGHIISNHATWNAIMPTIEEASGVHDDGAVYCTTSEYTIFESMPEAIHAADCEPVSKTEDYDRGAREGDLTGLASAQRADPEQSVPLSQGCEHVSPSSQSSERSSEFSQCTLSSTVSSLCGVGQYHECNDVCCFGMSQETCR